MSDRRIHTEESLRRDLAALGVTPEMTLVVHSSLRSIGWVLGGAPTVVRALLRVIGDGGTLAMPAATPHCVDPAQWPHAPATQSTLEEIREHLPVFDPRTTPTEMDVIPETFRTWPGTLRSDHPLESVCVRGPLAREVTKDHPLAFSEGPGSPFAELCDQDCRILLLGAGFNRCTALHFAESLVAKRRTTTNRVPLMRNGDRVWVDVDNVADDNDTHFPEIGKRFMAAEKATRARIGEAQSTLFPMRGLVDFAVEYFNAVL